MYRKAKPKEKVLSWLMFSAFEHSVRVWRSPEQLTLPQFAKCGDIGDTVHWFHVPKCGRCRPGMYGYSRKCPINQDTEELGSHPTSLGLGQEELIEPRSDW